MGAVYLERCSHGSLSGKSINYYCPYLKLILIRNANSVDWLTVVVTGGFALVNDNKVTILVNEAELGSVRNGNI